MTPSTVEREPGRIRSALSPRQSMPSSEFPGSPWPSGESNSEVFLLAEEDLRRNNIHYKQVTSSTAKSLRYWTPSSAVVCFPGELTRSSLNKCLAQHSKAISDRVKPRAIGCVSLFSNLANKEMSSSAASSLSCTGTGYPIAAIAAA
ncbi:hypothetical protein TURU_149504 [Turdus rufiventris]|nr:hypothetical protein TURU_149504 [Turdus rufiventris]